MIPVATQEVTLPPLTILISRSTWIGSRWRRSRSASGVRFESFRSKMMRSACRFLTATDHARAGQA